MERHSNNNHSPLALHFASLPIESVDRQSSGFSKLCSISVNDQAHVSHIPALSDDLLVQLQADFGNFTHAVNTNALESSAVPLTHQAFCASAMTCGHLLIDLFGLNKAHCQAVMTHYKLLKLQHPNISAHFVCPAVKHFYSAMG